jgi:hypothetical protein
MKNKDKIFDDIARVAGGTVNVFGGLSRTLNPTSKAAQTTSPPAWILSPAKISNA